MADKPYSNIVCVASGCQCNGFFRIFVYTQSCNVLAYPFSNKMCRRQRKYVRNHFWMKINWMSSFINLCWLQSHSASIAAFYTEVSDKTCIKYLIFFKISAWFLLTSAQLFLVRFSKILCYLKSPIYQLQNEVLTIFIRLGVRIFWAFS